ncbi:MAG TPA: hypothetical protein VHV55_04850 [Pirellulales bacterium]|nr:hypothetical protein [Pirellulales bacterium]
MEDGQIAKTTRLDELKILGIGRRLKYLGGLQGHPYNNKVSNMARPKAKTNRSAAIRDALKVHPGKTAAEIAKEVGVTPGLVYAVKSKMKTGGKKKGKRGRKPGRKPGANGAAPAAAHNALDSAFEFVTKVGGLLHAEQLIDKLKAFKKGL